MIGRKLIPSKTNEFLSWKSYNKNKLINNLRSRNWIGFDKFEQKVVRIRENIFLSTKPLTENVQVKTKERETKWFIDEIRQLKREKIELKKK